VEQFLYLTTKGWKTGKEHKIEIWFVACGGNHYLVSEGGRASHWVQNIEHEPRISFRVAGKRFEGTARRVDGETEAELSSDVARLMEAKYGWDGGFVIELKAKPTGQAV
jgi:deazaflavin-dependent oxidoreductase (nitroreductase family)